MAIVTDREMALEIARLILQMQMKEIAVDGVFERYRAPDGELSQLVLEGYGQLLLDRAYLDRIAELKTAFDAAKPGDDLIQILHKELSFGSRKH